MILEREVVFSCYNVSHSCIVRLDLALEDAARACLTIRDTGIRTLAEHVCSFTASGISLDLPKLSQTSEVSPNDALCVEHPALAS